VLALPQATPMQQQLEHRSIWVMLQRWEPSSVTKPKHYIVSLKSAKLLYIVSDRCIVILYCMFLF